MHFEINDTTTLKQIQKTFSDFYPYLQIAFYRKPHKKYEASEKKDLIDPVEQLWNVKKAHVSGLLEIQPFYTVAQVEKEFDQRFGLSVQILKKEKNTWEQTTGMDNFTLKELNEFGRSSSDEFILSEDDESL